MKKWLAVLLSFMILGSAVSALAETWTCPGCGKANQDNFCTSCGAKRPESWVCPGCGRENDTAFCGYCGTAKPSESAEIRTPEAVDQKTVSDHSDETDLAILLQHYPLPEEYRGLINIHARAYDLDPMLVAAIIQNESSFRSAVNSVIGARGLMQLTPDTASWIAGKLHMEDYTSDSLYDPETNIRFGCWLLHYYSELFNNDTVCMLAAYNAGQGTVIRWLADSAISDDGLTISADRLPVGTRHYVQGVLKSWQMYHELYTEDN